jgi:hypothetical protein
MLKIGIKRCHYCSERLFCSFVSLDDTHQIRSSIVIKKKVIKWKQGWLTLRKALLCGEGATLKKLTDRKTIRARGGSSVRHAPGRGWMKRWGSFAASGRRRPTVTLGGSVTGGTSVASEPGSGGAKRNVGSSVQVHHFVRVRSVSGFRFSHASSHSATPCSTSSLFLFLLAAAVLPWRRKKRPTNHFSQGVCEPNSSTWSLGGAFHRFTAFSPGRVRGAAVLPPPHVGATHGGRMCRAGRNAPSGVSSFDPSASNCSFVPKN